MESLTTWDRSESLEVMNVALPAIPQWRNLRIPFACIEHKVASTKEGAPSEGMTIWIGSLLTTPGKGWLVRHMVSELS